MRTIENFSPETSSRFYVCEECGRIEIPYIAQLLGYNPETFFRGSETEVRAS